MTTPNDDISIWEQMAQRLLWEILVPTCSNDGKPVRTRQHREWDSRVRRISGGLTVFPPTKGQWVAPDGRLYHDRMIPVRILATEAEIDKIIAMTGKFYDQRAILCYEISRNVKLVHFDSP